MLSPLPASHFEQILARQVQQQKCPASGGIFEPKASALKLSTLSCAIAIAELTANAAGPTLGQVAA